MFNTSNIDSLWVTGVSLSIFFGLRQLIKIRRTRNVESYDLLSNIGWICQNTVSRITYLKTGNLYGFIIATIALSIQWSIAIIARKKIYAYAIALYFDIIDTALYIVSIVKTLPWHIKYVSVYPIVSINYLLNNNAE